MHGQLGVEPMLFDELPSGRLEAADAEKVICLRLEIPQIAKSRRLGGEHLTHLAQTRSDRSDIQRLYKKQDEDRRVASRSEPRVLAQRIHAQIEIARS